MSCVHPFGHHKWTRIVNHGFDLFFEPFVVPNQPIFKALLRGAKIARHGLKIGSFHLFVHPK